jgi:hypothetical protein
MAAEVDRVIRVLFEVAWLEDSEETGISERVPRARVMHWSGEGTSVTFNSLDHFNSGLKLTSRPLYTGLNRLVSARSVGVIPFDGPARRNRPPKEFFWAAPWLVAML